MPSWLTWLSPSILSPVLSCFLPPHPLIFLLTYKTFSQQKYFFFYFDYRKSTAATNKICVPVSHVSESACTPQGCWIYSTQMESSSCLHVAERWMDIRKTRHIYWLACNWDLCIWIKGWHDAEWWKRGWEIKLMAAGQLTGTKLYKYVRSQLSVWHAGAKWNLILKWKNKTKRIIVMLVALKVCKVLSFGFIEENKTLSYNLLTE